MSPDAGPPAAAGVTYGIDIGGTKVLGIALGPADDVVAEARVPTPTGNREIVGSHVAEAVAQVVVELDRGLGARGRAHRSGSARPAWSTGAGACASRPTCRRPRGWTGPSSSGTACRAGASSLRTTPTSRCWPSTASGAARGHDDVVMVTLGTGIGGGIVSAGRVQVGSAGFAGEIGHMVVDPAGPACPCGRRGCWERFASGAGLGVLAREAALAGRLGEVVRLAGGDPESVRGEDVSAAAAAGDPAAQRVIREVGWWVGFGLANLACVLDPECFVLGGGVVRAGDLLVDAARATFAELVEGGDRRPPVVIVPAAFGERSGAVGAALAARQGGLW